MGIDVAGILRELWRSHGDGICFCGNSESML